MPNDLPNLDEDVSFVVDNGEPSGPMPMRTIIDSIRSGERAPDVLVWWAGAPEWMQFANEQGLFELLQELPATNQPPPPPELDEPERASFPEPQVTSFDLSTHESDFETVDEFEPGEELDDAEELDDVPDPSSLEEDHNVIVFDPYAEAEADAILSRDSRAMHPSSRWGYEEALIEEEPAEQEERNEELQSEPEPQPATLADTGLTGLFGARARGNAGLSETRAPAESLEAVVTTRSSLENVGARIDALTSATRRAQRFDLDDVPAGFDPIGDAPGDLERDEEPETGVLQEGSWQAVDPTTSSADSDEIIEWHDEIIDEPEAIKVEVAAEQPGEVTDEAVLGPDWELDERFAEMVRKSVEHQRRIDWATRVDELLLSSCITAIVENGFVVTDLDAVDSDHRVVFDHNADSRRVHLELSPLSSLNAAGDPVGRHVRVGLAWGREVVDPDEAFAVVRAEMQEGDLLPGTVTAEADLVASTATTRVELIWAADDFVHADHSVDRASLDASVAAALHVLEARWHQLFIASR